LCLMIIPGRIWVAGIAMCQLSPKNDCCQFFMRLVWFLRELCLQTIGLVFTKPAAVTLNFTSNSRFPSVCAR
jgi:hypothetical protein